MKTSNKLILTFCLLVYSGLCAGGTLLCIWLGGLENDIDAVGGVVFLIFLLAFVREVWLSSWSPLPLAVAEREEDR